MAQIINDPGAGTRLGSTLAAGLNQAAQHKLNFLTSQYEQEHANQQQRKQQEYLTQLQRQNQAYEKAQYASGLAPILGQDTANFLSNLSPKEREHALQNISSLMQLNQSPQQSQNGIGSLQSPIQEKTQPQSVSNQPQKDQDRGKLIEDIFTSPHEKREEEKLGIKKQEFERQTNKDAREYLKPYVERVSKAKSNIRDYAQLIDLAETGNIRSGNIHQLLKKVGLQDFGRNTTTELAGKLIARLAQNVAGVFGQNSRITNFLEQTFQRSLPDLINTKEGIIAISLLNKAVDQGELIKHDIRKQIIKENGGKLPGDIDDLIEERADPLVRKLEDDAFEQARAVTAPITNKKSDQLQKFQSLPPAYEYPGRKIRDIDTGKIVQSNGSQWIPVE